MPPRCCGASSCLGVTPARAGPSLPMPGRRASTTASAASTICTRCWHSSAHAIGIGRSASSSPLAEAASRPTRYGETTRLLGLPAVPRADRIRPRQRHSGDRAAREPAGAGTSTRRQPRAARRAAPDSAAGHRAHAIVDPSIRNCAAAKSCEALTAGPGLACRNGPFQAGCAAQHLECRLSVEVLKQTKQKWPRNEASLLHQLRRLNILHHIKPRIR